LTISEELNYNVTIVTNSVTKYNKKEVRILKYLITYDLNSPGQNYEALYEAIKRQGEWNHALQNTWFVKSQHSASQIRTNLKSALDSGDKLFVCVIGEWASTGMPDEADWLNNR
jgi:hypothetical protein